MIRKWRGNLNMGPEWSRLEKTFRCDDVEWVIFVRNNHPDFLNLKVCADGMAKHKANYWCSFRRGNGKPTAARDFKLMAEDRPELYSFVVEEAASLIGG